MCSSLHTSGAGKPSKGAGETRRFDVCSTTHLNATPPREARRPGGVGGVCAARECRSATCHARSGGVWHHKPRCVITKFVFPYGSRTTSGVQPGNSDRCSRDGHARRGHSRCLHRTCSAARGTHANIVLPCGLNSGPSGHFNDAWLRGLHAVSSRTACGLDYAERSDQCRACTASRCSEAGFPFCRSCTTT